MDRNLNRNFDRNLDRNLDRKLDCILDSNFYCNFYLYTKKFAHSTIVQRHGPYNTPLNQDTCHLDTCHKVQRCTYRPSSYLLHKLMLGTWCSLTHRQETLLQGAAEIVSHCIVNKQMQSASSYMICPFPDCDCSIKMPSIIWFCSTSVDIGALYVNN